MTKDQITAQIAILQALLAKRKSVPGYAGNCAAIQAQIAALQAQLSQ